MEQGENKIDISAKEKSFNIIVKLKGRTMMSNLETSEISANYSVGERTASASKTQKLDSHKPEIINYIFIEEKVENNIRLLLRDLEPTSGMYKVESSGISFTRVEGSEKDTEQVWEGTLSVIMPDYPPYPPSTTKRKKEILNIRIYDRAENLQEKTIVLDVPVSE